MRGAVIPHLSIKVFPTTFTLRRGYTVPRLFVGQITIVMIMLNNNTTDYEETHSCRMDMFRFIFIWI